MTRHRFTLLPLRRIHGPWRDTPAEAKADAVAAGFASPDEHVTGRVWLDELVEIERGEPQGKERTE